MLMLAVVLAEDYGVRYVPSKIGTAADARMGDGFFADAQDVFLQGLLGGRTSSPSPNPFPEERAASPKTEVRRASADRHGLNSPSPALSPRRGWRRRQAPRLSPLTPPPLPSGRAARCRCSRWRWVGDWVIH